MSDPNILSPGSDEGSSFLSLLDPITPTPYRAPRPGVDGIDETLDDTQNTDDSLDPQSTDFARLNLGSPLQNTIPSVYETPSQGTPHNTSATTDDTETQDLNERTKTTAITCGEARDIQAYDMGFFAALQIERNRLLQRSEEKHISSPEKRIFRREAQRLTTELENIGRRCAESLARLDIARDEELRLLAELKVLRGVGSTPEERKKAGKIEGAYAWASLDRRS
ncbi:hypothetical protein QBC46DRAFT_418664 [Diplogelasinospora grovesii]|uniref:Uncharacterized protein n=1 Tax=Diplogelasinospora grovesii TaxID=303347 RepID=A0AAN6N0M8_9PEZI|nr:hypothetical protein QBC46DRAFT_418664 [Diplogelasinospora grovesii]